MNHLNESIGNFKSLKKTPNSLLIQANNATAEIIVFTENIFRLTLTLSKGEGNLLHTAHGTQHTAPISSPSGRSGGVSYSVIQKPLPVKFKISETIANITISTNEIKLIIQKIQFVFHFIMIKINY